MLFSNAITKWIDRQPAVMRAATWTVLASLFVVSYTSMAKHLARDLPIPVIVFVRCMFGLLLFLPYVLRNGTASLKSSQPILMFSRGVSTMIALYCIFSAVSLIPIANAVAVQYAKPFVVALLAMVLLREIMTGARWLAMAIAFAGMLLIVKPGAIGMDASIWHLGIVFAIGAMIAEAYGTIALKFLTRDNPPDRTVAYMVLGMFVASSIPGLIYWQTPTLVQLGWLAAAAVAANLFQQCMARGFAAADATVVMPFEFARLIFAAILGAIFFGEQASIWTWLGGAVILAGALWLAHMEKRSKRTSA
ncbi:MAG: DMT family transporter [Hyphomicrobiales bacterium]|nr:DMT family transporter [Hyphomicrobiales bacterium]